MSKFAKILQIEYYVPKHIISNQDLANELDISVESIYKSTGIKTRYGSPKDDTPSDNAVNAAEKLFSITPEWREQIDYLIFCTQTFDQASPTTACTIQNRLHLSKNIGAIDVGLGCSGFVYCLSLAKALIESGQSKTVLILTSENLTKYLDPQDKSTRLLFGDAATATIVGTSDTRSIEDFVFGTDGSGEDFMYYKQGGFRYSLQEQINNPDIRYFRMNGLKVFYFSLKVIPELLKKLIDKNNLKTDLSDVNWLVFHQASKIILDTIKKKLNLPDDKFLYSLESFGNTVSSSIPITIKIHQENSIIRPGDKILIAGFGVGLSWSGTIITV